MSLQTSLSAFWQFENTSWTDELGTNNLTGTNSPTSVAGLVNNAVKFTSGGGQFLSHASATALVLGGGTFSFQVWVNLASGFGFATGDCCILSKNDGGGGHFEYGVGSFNSSGNKWFWRVYDSSNSFGDCISSVNVSTGWHHIVGTWDGTTQTIYVDGTSAGTLNPGITPNSSTSNFFIGKTGNGNSASAIQDVLIDQVGLWKGRVLSSTEVTQLYNSGAGLTYAAMAGATTPPFIANVYGAGQGQVDMIGY